MHAALTAIQKKQAGKATALMADVVTVEGLPLGGVTCSKLFGGEKRTEVTGAARAALVSCLGKEKWFSAKLPFRVEKRGDTWTVWVVLKPGYLPAEVPLFAKDDSRRPGIRRTTRRSRPASRHGRSGRIPSTESRCPCAPR